MAGAGYTAGQSQRQGSGIQGIWMASPDLPGRTLRHGLDDPGRNQLYLQGATPAAPLQGLRTWQHPESSGWLQELCRELRGAVWVPWASPSPRLLGLCRIWADSPRSHGGSVWEGGASSQEPFQHSRHRASGPVGGPPHAHPGAPRGTAAYLRVLAAGVQAGCSGGGE